MSFITFPIINYISKLCRISVLNLRQEREKEEKYQFFTTSVNLQFYVFMSMIIPRLRDLHE